MMNSMGGNLTCKKNVKPFVCCVVLLGTMISVGLYWTTQPTRGSGSTAIPAEDQLLRVIREADEECSSNETVTSQGGIITSPGFPNRYPSNRDCRWVLTAPDESSNIVLRIRTLDLEHDRGCTLDYLQIYLGVSTLAPSLDRFCGTVKDKVIVTNSSKVLIAFHSDPSYEEKGFSIEYYLQSSDDCQATLTAASGSFSSPNFPKNYPDNSDCWTLISGNEGKLIVFQFKTIELEYDENCTYDFVEVYDGATKEAPSLGRFCTTNQKLPIHSATNALLIHFHSDHLVNKKGFNAQYTTVTALDNSNLNDIGDCVWESEETNGSIASPNYPNKYPSSARCNILLTAPIDNIIKIHFDSILLEIEPNCTYDFIEISDGTGNGTQTKRLCGKLNEEQEFTSSKNVVLIKFESDDFAEFSGFKLTYKFVFPYQGNQQKQDNVTTTKPGPNTTQKPERFLQKDGIFLEKPRNATLELGASYMLECAVSDPIAKIRWLKDEEFLGGNTPLPGLKRVANNTLWIQSMNQKLAGIYKCAAVTEEDTFIAVARISLQGDSSPHDAACSIVFRKKPRDASFTEGEYAHMECLAGGNQVQTQWERKGHVLQTKDHITVLRNGLLFMDKVTLEDAGIYTCVVTDMISGCKKRAEAHLIVNGKAKLQEICGQPKAGKPFEGKPRLDHGKIVGGHDTNKGAYPWQVMLWESRLKSFCGASLINERWIVTAAHCFVSYKRLRWDDIVIKIGKHNREIEEPEEFNTVIAEASAVVIHPAYNKDTFDNDIALVRLRDHIQFSDYIIPICLGERETYEIIMNNPSLTVGTVTGWGKLKEFGGSPKYLQEIKMPLVDHQTCTNSTTFLVTRNMFCAGYAQEIVGDACHGDSGGPFIVNQNGKWVLVGIVSWGEGCGKANKYGFYTKVMNYLPWIKGIMRS